MNTGTVRGPSLTAWGMTLFLLLATSAAWSSQVDLWLTVRDPNGNRVPQFEAMLHSHEEGYVRWQRGKDGDIHFGFRGTDSLSLREDPHIQVIVRAPGLAPAILHLEYTMPVKETVTLTPGRLVDLLVRTADGRSIPQEITPLVIYSDFIHRVRPSRMPENQRPGEVDDFEMSKVQRIAEGHYQFRVPVKTSPFLLAIHAPGFMRSVESNYFDEDALTNGKIEWEIPAAAKLHFQFNADGAPDLSGYESSWIAVAGQIPEEGKYITVWLQQGKRPTCDVTLNDLPPNRYRGIVRLFPPESPKTDVGWYVDDAPFQLAAGEEKTLKLTYAPSDPNGWRGSTAVDVVVREYGGKPAAGRPFTLTYVLPHDGDVPVREGILDGEGRFQVAKVGSGPNGPEFFLRVGKEWARRIRVTEAGNQRFEFTLAPEVNDVVPDVAFTEVNENKPISLRSLRGHVVYVEFWATWCGPCQIPMIRLNEMMRKRPPHWEGRVDVLAASIDDRPEVVKWYVKHRGWNHVRHWWTGTDARTAFASPAAEAFGVNGVPTAFLIAPDGRIVWKGHPKGANPKEQIDELFRSADKASDKTK
jgi:thiol-disulfide isomerase/thioredoxin